MRPGAILIATAGFILVTILGSYAVAQDPERDCTAEHEKWSKALAGLQDQLELLRRVKGQSLEPRITEQLRSSSDTRTTVARIVRSAIKEHERKVAEAEKEVLGVAAREKSSFTEWQACMTRNRGRSNRADRALFQATLKDRQKVLKLMESLL